MFYLSLKYSYSICIACDMRHHKSADDQRSRSFFRRPQELWATHLLTPQPDKLTGSGGRLNLYDLLHRRNLVILVTTTAQGSQTTSDFSHQISDADVRFEAVDYTGCGYNAAITTMRDEYHESELIFTG